MGSAVKGIEAIRRYEAAGGREAVEHSEAIGGREAVGRSAVLRDPGATDRPEGPGRFEEAARPAMSVGSEAINHSEIHGQLCEMMRLNMEIDDLYEKHASKSSVSPTAFWLLYALMENGGGRPLTQRRFCKEWSYSPQTVNSCLKKLQLDGLVSLASLPGSKKEKGIELTDYGEETARCLVGPLMAAEARAFGSISREDRLVTLRVLRGYLALLDEEIKALEV